MPDTSPSPRALGLLASDDVFPELMTWGAAGLNCALVTLTGIDGAAPRPLGAHMAIAEDGRFKGYLSGGCLEHTIVEAALEVIRAGENRLIRYGKGSPYFDLKLPCGSGLDLYFDQALNVDLLKSTRDYQIARRPFSIATNLETGAKSLSLIDEISPPVSARSGNMFYRTVLPTPRLFIAGSGPALTAIALLASAAGFDLVISTPDDSTRAQLASHGITARAIAHPETMDFSGVDPFTAVIVAFHEHDWEPPLLAKLLKTPCFYIGVLGSKAAHESRIAKLKDAGITEKELARLRAPIGLIQGAKSQASIAISVLAEVAGEAKKRMFIW
jgi:xanthine dehydrogenase accessory factor